MSPEAALARVTTLRLLSFIAADLADHVPAYRPSDAWRDHLEWERGRKRAEQLLEAGHRHQETAAVALELLAGVALGTVDLARGRLLLRRVAVLLVELGQDPATFPRVVLRRAQDLGERRAS